MGMRGKKAEGKKRTGGVSATVSVTAFKPSSFLDSLAKKYWRSLVGSFPVGHFSEQDRILLEQYCRAAADHQRAIKYLDDKGSLYGIDRYGREYMFPAVKVQEQARSACAMLATKLRITKTSMISPKTAGSAANQGQMAKSIQDEFDGLLIGPFDEARQ